MKPFNLIALLCFLGGATWALTRSERTVREIQSHYYSIMMPFLKVGSAIEIQGHNFLREVKHSKELEAELEVTRTELDRLRQIEQRFSTLENENSRLRQSLEFKQNTPFKIIAARITRRQTSNWYKTVEINRGEECNIGNQNPVVTAEGLVGKIDLTKNELSTVLLLTDEKCQVSAKVEGSPEIGILSGKRAEYGEEALLRLRYLSKKANVKKGQRVFTNGRGGIFPANILLGTIESVEPGALDSEAIVRPAVNFTELVTVFVIPKQ